MSIPTSHVDTNTKRILVIEDSDDLRADVLEMLNLEGYITYGAEDGVVGVEMAQELLPDLIVCDIMMPRLNGYGVLQALRANNTTSVIPFIFLTAKTEHMDQRHGMVLGAEDYLTKPFMVPELLKSISVQLQKRADQMTAVQKRIESISHNIATALPHELRTPLNTIIGFSEMLQTEAQNLKPDQVAGWSQYIHSAGHRLYRLIENYLYFVQLQLAIENNRRLEIEQPTLQADSVIIGQSEEVAQTHKRQNDLVLNLDTAPELAININDFTKIIEELVDNAFKFSSKATPVTITGYLDDADYVLTIHDEGRGMTNEHINQIGGFMQFERMQYEQQGMGLGLVICQLLAKAYNFSLSIDSQKEVSTTITLRMKAN